LRLRLPTNYNPTYFVFDIDASTPFFFDNRFHERNTVQLLSYKGSKPHLRSLACIY
jgi:hypothetical protein